MGSRRTEKMASLVRGELSRILFEESSDPRLKDLVITEVKLSPDLKHARVYFGSQVEWTEKQEKEVNSVIRHASPFFRRRIGENLEMRYVPELIFQRDHHTSEVGKLMDLMASLSKDSPQ